MNKEYISRKGLHWFRLRIRPIQRGRIGSYKTSYQGILYYMGKGKEGNVFQEPAPLTLEKPEGIDEAKIPLPIYETVEYDTEERALLQIEEEALSLTIANTYVIHNVPPWVMIGYIRKAPFVTPLDPRAEYIGRLFRLDGLQLSGYSAGETREEALRNLEEFAEKIARNQGVPLSWYKADIDRATFSKLIKFMNEEYNKEHSR